MQSCVHDVLGIVADILYEPWDEGKKLAPNSLWCLALTCKSLALATQHHRFRTVVLDEAEGNNQLARLVERSPTLLAGTTQLVWNKRWEDLSEWMTLQAASVVMEQLTAVDCLVVRKLPIRPADFAEWKGAAKVFASIRELRIVPYLIVDHPSGLFDFLGLLPLLEVLQIKLGTPSLRPCTPSIRQRTAANDEQPLRIHPPSMRRLRTFDLQILAEDYKSEIGSFEDAQMKVFVNGLLESMRASKIYRFAMNARHETQLISFLNFTAENLQELHIHLPWLRPPTNPWSAPPTWASSPESWKLRSLPCLKLIQFHDMASVPPEEAARLLRAVFPYCTDISQLSVCLFDRDMPLHSYLANFPLGKRWGQLDEELAISGCREILVDVCVSLPGASQNKPAPDMLAKTFPKCHALGKLRLDIGSKKLRHAQAQVLAWSNSVSAVGEWLASAKAD